MNDELYNNNNNKDNEINNKDNNNDININNNNNNDKNINYNIDNDHSDEKDNIFLKNTKKEIKPQLKNSNLKSGIQRNFDDKKANKIISFDKQLIKEDKDKDDIRNTNYNNDSSLINEVNSTHVSQNDLYFLCCYDPINKEIFFTDFITEDIVRKNTNDILPYGNKYR